MSIGFTLPSFFFCEEFYSPLFLSLSLVLNFNSTFSLSFTMLHFHSNLAGQELPDPTLHRPWGHPNRLPIARLNNRTNFTDTEQKVDGQLTCQLPSWTWKSWLNYGVQCVRPDTPTARHAASRVTCLLPSTHWQFSTPESSEDDSSQDNIYRESIQNDISPKGDEQGFIFTVYK